MNLACRQCRRENVKLFLKGDRCYGPTCAMVKKAYAPGQHGAGKFSKQSEYGKQLREKQKVRRIYNINETQLRNYYTKASSKVGDTSENLLTLLESRFDTIVYRSGIFSSRAKAKQYVNHAFFKLNGKNCNIPSCNIAPGDEITVKDSKTIVLPEQINSSSWMTVTAKPLKIKLNHLPVKEEIELPFDLSLVIEYYSR